jgi:hypothetical protein
MVKFTAKGDNGRTVLGFGVNEENVQRLKADEPIKVRLDDPKGINLGLPIDIMIFYGETQEALVEGCEPMFTDQTVFHGVKRADGQ